MRKRTNQNMKRRYGAELFSIVIFVLCVILWFSGCRNDDNHKPEKALITKKTTVSSKNDECTEICNGFKDKKRSLCLTMCRPSLSPETMRLKHSTEMKGLLTCDDTEIKAAVDKLVNIQESNFEEAGLYFRDTRDWPICYTDATSSLLSFFDDIYWDVVKYGLPAVPCLIEKTKDTTLTQENIPHFSDRFGRFRAGDVAYYAIWDIVERSNYDVWAVFDGKYNSDGLDVYYEFVSSKNKRNQLHNRLEEWWKTENANLIWIKAPCHSAGGFWTNERRFKELVEETAESLAK